MGSLDINNYSRVQTLQDDVDYFRSMLEQILHQNTECKDCHGSFTRSGKLSPGINCEKKHKKYLNLLNKTQAFEAESHLRLLEKELSTLIQNGTQGVKMGASCFE